MESNHLIELLEESIRLELNAATLYETFADYLPEDNLFWWQLHIEERSHANLLRAARDTFAGRDSFPQHLLAESIEEVRKANAKIEQMIEKCRQTPPSRAEACRIAISIENEAGENHYNRFMGRNPESSTEGVFQQLNRNDRDHEVRIREYLDTI